MNFINFSENNVTTLANIIDELNNTLTEAEIYIYSDTLHKIKLAAQNNDNDAFQKFVINRGLFGGAGALWEIWIDNKKLLAKFQKEFYDFADCIIKMGIDNLRIIQIKETMKKIRERE